MAIKATKVKVRQQSGTDRTLFATWEWPAAKTKQTEEYQIRWHYDTGNNVWFEGSSTSASDTNVKQSTYDMPDNAKRVRFKVRPISNTHKVKGKNTKYWTADWTAWVTFNAGSLVPETPSAPTVSVDKLKLTTEVDYYGNADKIEFVVVDISANKNHKTSKPSIALRHATFSCNVSAGKTYKVRCRAIKGKLVSAWSEYSTVVGTQPSDPKQFTSIRALSASSILLEWSKIATADSYVIEYTQDQKYFDSNPSMVQSVTISSVCHAELTGLETGKRWYFRHKAVNEYGESNWSYQSKDNLNRDGKKYTQYQSLAIGKKPNPPTTWTLVTTAKVGDIVSLYWVHNAQDESSQTYAKIELTVNGVTTELPPIKNTTDEDEKDKTSVYALDTSQYSDGATIKWRVCTKGAVDDYGDWSISRTIDIYAPSTLSGSVELDGDYLRNLPVRVSLEAGPTTQNAIRYSVSIDALETYEGLDLDGNSKWVNKGESVYTKIFDPSEDEPNSLDFEIGANETTLMNNASYVLRCSVIMDSGLSSDFSTEFTVAWDDLGMEPNAEISIDEETLSAYIMPYCEDSDGNRLTDVLLSVYRRNYDGTMTEIASAIPGYAGITVADPHPALDYARYRIVAIDQSTGKVESSDLPGEPVGESSVVIQWDETWSNYDVTDEDDTEEPSYAGSMLKLPYNIDVGDNFSPDVALVEYIGRRHPVSYYGTQRGITSSWSVDVPKEDVETLYALRRLSVYQGDCYVREPSGTGYWAQVVASYNINHCELIVPVTFSITRVEGGA